MANPSQSQNQLVAEPSLRDVLSLLKKEIMLELSCHHLGTIQTFDPGLQTATVSINYTKTYFEIDPKTGLYSPVQVEYTPLADCPCVILGGGPSSLTFPIAAGDQCLVIFNDRDFDDWFQGGAVGPVATSRLHAYTDAIALVGVRSKNHSLENYDTTRTVWSNGTTLMALGNSLIKFQNDQHTLKALLNDLIDAVKDLVTATAAITVTGVSGGMGASGPPANVAAINAVTSTLTTVSSDIAGLLE